jgi:uncharacterized protein
MRVGFFGLFGFLIFTIPVAADDWFKALVAFDAERYDVALALLTPLAEAGKVEAQEILVDMYTHGHGVPADAAAAFEWTRRAAKQGHPPAQEAMGHSYLDGSGVPMDEVKAVHWFGLAAEQGAPGALYNLGALTMHGRGIKADPEEAVRLFHQAAELDNPDALYILGGMYLQSPYVTPDIDTSLKYLARAGELGQRRASALLANMLQEIPEVEDHLLKSAIHFQIAIAAGCDDLDAHAAQAVARLSPEERASYEYNLAIWVPPAEPGAHEPSVSQGHCLSE